jgi:hypothetical protein
LADRCTSSRNEDWSSTFVVSNSMSRGHTEGVSLRQLIATVLDRPLCVGSAATLVLCDTSTTVPRRKGIHVRPKSADGAAIFGCLEKDVVDHLNFLCLQNLVQRSQLSRQRVSTRRPGLLRWSKNICACSNSPQRNIASTRTQALQHVHTEQS